MYDIVASSVLGNNASLYKGCNLEKQGCVQQTKSKQNDFFKKKKLCASLNDLS